MELPKSLIKTSAGTLLEARGISKQLQGKTILQPLDFTIHRREIITLIGPNGSGKTTLLKCLLGLVRPDGGQIARRRGLTVGYVPQNIHFDLNLPLTVKAFLRLSCPQPIEAARMIALTGIGELMEQQLHTLSGGEMRRVLLAQALFSRPELLVLDEPAKEVDVAGQADLYQIIRTASRELGAAVLMVSHDLHLVMADTDRVFCLNGHICCTGTPQSVSRDPAFIRLFGEEVARQMSLYVHHHDHHHDLHGDVVCDHAHEGGEGQAGEGHSHGAV